MLKKILILLIIIFTILITFFSLKDDIFNFNMNNYDIEKVINARYFSSYRGVFVIKLPINDNAFSCGIIFLGDDVNSINTVKHEYGHFLQLKELGLIKYMEYIFIPSVYYFWLGVEYSDYYSLPWEYGADLYGKVNRYQYDYHDDSLKNYIEYWNNIK